MYLCTRFWFRSSVGLEQRPSKAWVLGSNPNEVTLWLLRNHESIITREFITSRKELSFSLFINDLRK